MSDSEYKAPRPPTDDAAKALDKKRAFRVIGMVLLVAGILVSLYEVFFFEFAGPGPVNEQAYYLFTIRGILLAFVVFIVPGALLVFLSQKD